MTDQPSRGDGNKVLAGIFGILLGGLGLHRFILGDPVGGILRITISVFSCGTIGPLIGLIEGIIYLTKSDEEFIEIYVDGDKAWF